MDELQGTFKLKDDKVEAPDMYLGAKVERKVFNGNECRSMSSDDYVKTAVANLEERLAKDGMRLPSKCYTPIGSGIRPEMDVS
jgi:hypothetical protein